ncbi:hypothetical protein [Raoultibacter phocaeensis]|uniref:hypothetical protein n=1 Tax=Raoultibacter phocaeensis TaxID=2479841 RepID=UPI00111B9536|nr:hypothetical protein [Raoultibacter phocaeensis]
MNGNDIKGAFERMGPTPEAEDRMLAAILAENDALGDSDDSMNTNGTTLKKSPAKRLVFPLAACLVLLVGIGAFAGASYFASLNSQLGGASPHAASTATLSEEAEGEKSAASPSDATPATPSPAASMPRIELEDGTLLRIASVGETEAGESEVLTADSNLVGDEIGQATARSESGAEVMDCTVYAYPDERNPYAIRYTAGTDLYLAARDDAQGEPAPAA